MAQIDDTRRRLIKISARLACASLSTAGVAASEPTVSGSFHPRTAAESAAGITPKDTTYPPQSILRYGANSNPKVTDMANALQSAIDSASPDSAVISFSNDVAISRPILIRANTQENITLQGNTRVSSALFPTAANIASLPQKINCLIFNQNNNPHLHLERFEFTSVVGFSGVCVYCVENGGADHTGQCLFSCVFYDTWMGMPTTNSGFLWGGMQNCVVDTMEFEGCAVACFRFEGVGCDDVFFVNNAMVSCFDQFISQVADTHGAVNVTVNGLHAYNHMRGALFKVQNWVNCTIANVDLLVAAKNMGATGLGSFHNCSNLKMNGFSAVPTPGTAPCATAFNISGDSTAKFTDGQVVAHVGVLLDGTGTVDVDFENVDFSNLGEAALMMLGTGTGVLRTRNCRFSNSQASLVVQGSLCRMDWYSYNDEFVNSGLGGSEFSRNLKLAPASAHRVELHNPRIGKTSDQAAASTFVENSGAGLVQIIHPTWLGKPSAAYVTNNGSGSVNVAVKPGYGGEVPSAASLSLPVDGDSLSVTGSSDISAIDEAAYNFPGRRVTLMFQEALSVRSGKNLKVSRTFNADSGGALSLIYDGHNWVEVARH